MGNTTSNTFADKSTNQSIEHKGYTVNRIRGARGFRIKPVAGETPRVLRGTWLKQEQAIAMINGYLESPEVKARKEKAEVRKTRAAATKKEEPVNVEASSE